MRKTTTDFNGHKSQTIRIAKELFYSNETIDKIKNAKTESEIHIIMQRARHEQINTGKYYSDNMRGNPEKKENKYSHKLTNDDVRYIKKNYIKGSPITGRDTLARKFDVSRSCIDDIIAGRTYKNVV